MLELDHILNISRPTVLRNCCEPNLSIFVTIEQQILAPLVVLREIGLIPLEASAVGLHVAPLSVIMTLAMKLALLLALASFIVVIFRPAGGTLVACLVWTVAPFVAILPALVAGSLESAYPRSDLVLIHRRDLVSNSCDGMFVLELLSSPLDSSTIIFCC